MKKYLFGFLLFVFSSGVVSQEAANSEEFVTYGELLRELESIAKNTIEPSEVVKQEFLDFQKSHGISNSEKVYQDFVRIRLAFEATRDSGLWQIRWKITDREPNSNAIWKQWNNIVTPQYQTEKKSLPTADAECDELSALFAFIVRGLGVKNVGLFWPTWNHTVAVWTTKNKSGDSVRIVVPTSQVFLSAKATLGTKEFDSSKQKTIYQYDRKDISIKHKIPKPLAEMMLKQVKEYGVKSSSYLQERRNRLSNQFGGS